jgi:hypothetical protein
MSEEASESTASENDASSEGADTLEGTLATTEAEDAPNTTDAEGTLESLVDAPTDEQDPFNYPMPAQDTLSYLMETKYSTSNSERKAILAQLTL